MIKSDAQKPDSGSETQQKNDGKPSRQDSTAGSASLNDRQKLAEEAENFCADLERFFRRSFGEVPKAADLGELRAQQASVRELVNRAGQSGGESSEQVAALTAEKEKLKDAATRARADFLNYQARSAKDLDRAEELALRRYVLELLPIMDSFELARQDASTDQADVDRLRAALDMIGTSLQQTLAVRGLERIEAKGKPFDPTIHEAVAKRPAERGEAPNSVVEELRPGYKWKGLILRPAQVLVSDSGK